MPLVDLGPNFAVKVSPETLKTVAWVRIEPVPPIPPAAGGCPFHVAIRLRDAALPPITSRQFSDAGKCKEAYDALVALIP